VPSFPAADQKARVQRRLRRCGGLTGTALVAAARLGARCAYAGCLGTDEISHAISANFASEGVDTSHAPRLPEAKVNRSTIVVAEDTGSRTIFSEVAGLVGAHPALPPAEVIRDSKVLLIDHFGMEGNLRAARIARESQVAVVADFDNRSSPLLPDVLDLVDHLILSAPFATRLTGQPDAAAAARALWRSGRAAVVVTCGKEGSWSVSAHAQLEPCHHPAFEVRAVDTTGCGDVFHGAYAAALARGDSLAQRIRFAAAVAALKAALADIPRCAAVEQFLMSHPPH
jgi:sulfofructose kinase